MPIRDEFGIRQPIGNEWQAKTLCQGYIADYQPFSFVDGLGVRCSLYVSGCLFQCPGCYNQAAQNFRYGTPYTTQLETQILTDLAQPYVAGLSILGGEPFLNLPTLLPLVQQVRTLFGKTKTIWVWSGFTYEQLQQDPEKQQFLQQCDVLVDGPYVEKLHRENLAFRGSRNQRVIEISTGKIMEY